MADLWDTDDESAVEELVAQAQDQSLLEQISAINCSSFSHSELPPDLDSRFRRLKSIPPPTAPPPVTLNHDDGLTNLNSGTENGTSPSKKSVEKTTSLPGSESPDSSLELEPESPSPPRKSGCFWCSPKKASTRRKKGEEFASDLGILSEKSQRRLMKRAMEEEERINREVEKILKLAKQASFTI